MSRVSGILSAKDALANGLDGVRQEPQRKFVQAILDRFDGDHDGKLSAAELDEARREYRKLGFDAGLNRTTSTN